MTHATLQNPRAFKLQGTVRGRTSGRCSLTAKQQTLLDGLVAGPLVFKGRELDRSYLMSVFCGHQLPKDPELCQILDVERPSLSQVVKVDSQPMLYQQSW